MRVRRKGEDLPGKDRDYSRLLRDLPMPRSHADYGPCCGQEGAVILIDHGDHPGGDLDQNGIEVDEPEKGTAFDEMWGLTKRG